MAVSNPVCGVNGLIYVSGAVVGEANAWSIAIEAEKGEYATFGDTWYSKCVGPRRWSGSIDAVHEQDAKKLQNAATAGVAVALLIYPKRSDLTTFYNGSAVFDFESGGEVGGDPVADSASFEGSGTLTMTGFSA